MSNQEILEKAIQKSIDGGWAYPFGSNTYEIIKYVQSRPESIAFGFREKWQDADTPGHLEGHWAIPELIFNHEFAKALWGELPKRSADMYDCPQDEIGQIDTCNWEHHLQQMVIADDSIKYLGENI